MGGLIKPPEAPPWRLQPLRPTIAGHLAICRFDHWFKNVFVLPGIVVALAIEPHRAHLALVTEILVGLFAIGLIASSNYVLNELRDAPYDQFHPSKRTRPVPSGQVHRMLAYLQWLGLAILGTVIGLWISLPFALTLVAFWVMGGVYNLKPIRSKDLPYLDVLSEALNNPLRLLAGWFIVIPDAIAPGSLLVSYWMMGCYFMGLKRFAEYRHLDDPVLAARYRPSLGYYNENRLLVSVMFYGSTAMLMFGAFLMRYRLSLILSFPFVALVMALYLDLGLAKDSPVQRPESLYKQPRLMAAIIICAVVLTLCVLYDLPILEKIFASTAPSNLTVLPP